MTSAGPPAPPAPPGDDATASPLTFPTDFPVKIMGRSVDGFVETMVAIVQTHAPEFDPATIELRTSSGGNYTSLTATIRATSRAQLDALYRELSGHPLVRVAL